MASLEHRIADLEAASPPPTAPVVILVDPVPGRDEQGHQIPKGEIIGIKDLVKRERGESERTFLVRVKARAVAEARPDATAVLLLIERSIGEGQSDGDA